MTERYLTTSEVADLLRVKPKTIRNKVASGIFIEGVHFFKTQPERSIGIIQRRYDKEGALNRAQATYVYHQLAPLLAPKLYPTMRAIANVYEEAKREDADAARINPMELWDTHHIRRLDDAGFIDALYREGAAPADPELIAERKQRQAEAVAAVRACGHLESERCDCH